ICTAIRGLGCQSRVLAGYSPLAPSVCQVLPTGERPDLSPVSSCTLLCMALHRRASVKDTHSTL
ncbi:unnamed protein product, partial [Staurois parvus]